MIRIFVGNDHRSWDEHLHEFHHAINTAVHKTTKVSPAFLNYGRQPKPVVSLRREVENNSNKQPSVVFTDPGAWKDRLKRLDTLRDLVAQFIDKERDKRKNYYDKNREDARFKVGNFVMRKGQYLSFADKKFSAILEPRYEESLKIFKVLSPAVYELESCGNKSPMVHVKLKVKKSLRNPKNLN